MKRLVYTSSVAAYGFHSDNPQPLTEDVPARGSDAHYYSAEKAELESTLWNTVAGSGLDTYVFRPCIVAGADALMPIESIPWPLRRSPLTVLPDPGVRFQVVHHDDVATALVAAARGAGTPGDLQPRGPGRADRRRPRPRARLAQRPDPARRRLARRRGDRHSRSCPRRRSGSTRSARRW